MRCLKCNHQNKPTSKFCSRCGTKLGRYCPQCGTSVDHGDRFCTECSAALPAPTTSQTDEKDHFSDALSYTPGHLAKRILHKRTLIEGERRTITVLYVDAQGFTPISEHLGEEAVFDLSKDFVHLMLESVHRYEGTVNQFRGDGILALFGAPIAHEDSARRAVSAALEMQHTLKQYAEKIKPQYGIDLQFRIGLNTGPVVVGKIHDNLEMEFSAYGDTMNLGARMEEMAEPGSIFLSENTFRAVSDYFECTSLGPLEVKGKEQPIHVYQALRPKAIRTRFEAATERGLSPYVGREHELQVLLKNVEQVYRGQGQVMFISSEAGTGKTRLLLEFRKRTQNQDIRWLEGHCISFGQNISYLPFIDIIRHTFRVEEDDNPENIIGKIDSWTSGWEDSAKSHVPYLKYLLSVDPGDDSMAKMDPMIRRAGILDGLRAIFIEESRKRPLIVVVEDLHWIDQQSESVIQAMVDLVASIPVLFILTYRPYYKNPLGERTYFNRMSLNRLLPEEEIQLASGILQTSNFPQGLNRIIVKKGEGNPFYIEEVINSLLETDVLTPINGNYILQKPIEEIRIPETIHEIILSRIDRLDQQSREAIQLASVIGREFTYRLLDRIYDVEAELKDRLDELKVLELIHQKSYFPELSYMFKHALTQDVAYSTLLKEKRKVLHRIIGQAIETLYAERIPEQFEVLAYHYLKGQDWKKALEYLLKSAHKSEAALANTDAMTYYDRALKAYEKLDEEDPGILIEIYKGKAELFVANSKFTEAVKIYALIETTARSSENFLEEGLALTGAAYAQVFLHQFAEVEEKIDRALVLARQSGNDLIKLATLVTEQFYNSVRGHLEKGIITALEILKLSDEQGSPYQKNAALMGLNAIYSWQGKYKQGLLHGEKGTQIADQARLAFPLVHTRLINAFALGGMGRYSDAILLLKNTISLCQRMDEKISQARQWNTLGWIYHELGHWDKADEHNTKSLDLALAVGDPEIIYNARLNLADTACMNRKIGQAHQMLEELYANLDQQHEFMKWRYRQRLAHRLGEVLLTKGDNDRAIDLANECLELAEQTESRKNIIKGRRLRGQVFLAQGKLSEAEKELQKALEVAREIGNPPQLWKTYVALGDLREAQHNQNAAREAYQHALSVIEEVANGLDDQNLKETFLNSEPVRSIREKVKLPE